MEYQEFICHVKDTMETCFMDKKIDIKRVIKNNDVELDALVIVSKDQPVSPTVYLNEYYDDYIAGKNIEDIEQEIFYVYENHYEQLNFNIERFSDFQMIKDRIAYKIVNKKMNKSFLRDVPYVNYLDFAIVFYYMLDDTNNGNAIAVIHNSHLEMWGISKSELYSTAMVNTPRLLPYSLKSMDMVIADILFHTTIPADTWKEELKMYVLSNKQKFYGAGCILYKDVLRNLAEKLDKDLYILPSSVHEVIIIPVESGDKGKDELTELVKEVNVNELVKSEILSDHAYLYLRDKDQILI